MKKLYSVSDKRMAKFLFLLPKLFKIPKIVTLGALLNQKEVLIDFLELGIQKF